jgi:UDP-N-acetyl-2-amino-2-deoxyglucuronate dehydrogenase
MVEPLRFGIVGTGSIAQAHATALAALAPQATLIACCDVVPGRAAAFAQQWQTATPFDSWQEMLNSGRLDAVCICTPHPQHAEPLVAAAERGVHGIVEKPLTATLADADRVLEASAKYGTIVSTMSQRRWYPAAQQVRRAIDDGLLGAPILGESYGEMGRDEAYYRSADWRGRWDTEGGGVLMNQAPHNIDFLLWYMGPAEQMFGYWANLTHPYVEIEDNAVAVIRFRSGALATLKASVSMKPERRIHGVTLLGASGGTVSFDCWQVPVGQRRTAAGPSDVGSNDTWTLANADIAPVGREAAIQSGAGELPNFHAHQLLDVIGAIRDKRPPAVTALDGRRVVAIIQGVYESARSGRPVQLTD